MTGADGVVAEPPDPDEAYRQQLRIAALRVVKDEVLALWETARAEAEPGFAAARNGRQGLDHYRPSLDGVDLGLITVYAGGVQVDVDEAALTEWANQHAAEAWHDYIEPHVVEDRRVIALIKEHFPEMVDRRIRADWRAKRVDEAARRKGRVTDKATGDTKVIATVTPQDATGRFAYKPSDEAAAAIFAALRDGRLSAETGARGLGPLAIEAPQPVAVAELVDDDTADDDGLTESQRIRLFALADVLGHGGHGGWQFDPADREVRCACGAVLVSSNQGWTEQREAAA